MASILDQVIQMFQPKPTSPVPQGQVIDPNAAAKQKKQVYDDAYMRIKMSGKGGELNYDQVKDLVDKYGSNQLLSEIDTPQQPVPQQPQQQGILGAMSHAVQQIAGGQGQIQAAPMPSPTPSDQQFPTQLAQLQNDPGAQYNDVISKAAQENNMPAPVLKAVLAHESMQFNPKYVGGYHTDQYGRGVAGIDKRAHPEISDQQAFDPNFAIPYAAHLLSGYHNQQGDWGGALRQYNGGGNYASTQPGYQGVPVNQRTMDYMNNVYQQALKYGGKSQ